MDQRYQQDYHLGARIPAWFVYEPASGRLFYEPSMKMVEAATWKKAANVAWGPGNGKRASL